MILQEPPTTAIIVAYSPDANISTEVDECLNNKAEFSDLLRKRIMNETFTEADAERIMECVDEQREHNTKIERIGISCLRVVISIWLLCAALIIWKASRVI